MSGIMAAMLGAGGVQFSLSIAPANQSLHGTASNKQFTGEVVTITGTSTGATYNWTILPNDIYNWGIVSGQGTNTCVAKVTGVQPVSDSGEPASAILQCDVTVLGVTKSISADLNYTNTA